MEIRAICPQCQWRAPRTWALRLRPSRARCPRCDQLFEGDPRWDWLGSAVFVTPGVVLFALAFFDCVSWMVFAVAVVATLALIVLMYPYLTKYVPVEEGEPSLNLELLRRCLTRKNCWLGCLAAWIAVSVAFLWRELARHAFDGAWDLSFLFNVLAFLFILATAAYYGAVVPFVQGGPQELRPRSLRSRWSAVSVIVLSALLCCHFVTGSALWAAIISAGTFSFGYTSSHAWPCFALLGMSILTFLAAAKQRGFAVALLGVTLAAAVFACWYDLSHERWQIRVLMVRAEHAHRWKSGETYLTWWWY